MSKFPEAEARKFHNVFVCRRCKSKRKAPNMKVIEGKVACRVCGTKQLRPVKKK